MQIGEVAQLAAVSVDTIRFYERRGVLPPPARRPSGYRVYGPATVERIRLARAFQNIGFTLAEIIDALHRLDLGEATCASERWRLEAVLARIESQMAELERVRNDVKTVLGECDTGHCRFGLSAPSAG